MLLEVNKRYYGPVHVFFFCFWLLLLNFCHVTKILLFLPKIGHMLNFLLNLKKISQATNFFAFPDKIWSRDK